MIDNTTIKRLAIQCGVFERFDMDSDMEHPQTAGDMDCLAKFAKACYAAGQDAQRERIILLLHGIDRDQCEASDGWWETSYGAEFGADILAKIRANKEP